MSSSSRLSSLLVRDGVVGVKRMEQAFQRQVIYSGATWNSSAIWAGQTCTARGSK